MTSLEKRRQDLIAEKALVMARRVTIIMPHYIVLPGCAEHCRQLRKVAKEAILKAVQFPDSQIVVIGDKHPRFGICNAYAYIEGGLEVFWPNATPENPAFLHNPGAYTTSMSGGRTVSSMMQQAFANGAQDYDELP